MVSGKGSNLVTPECEGFFIVGRGSKQNNIVFVLELESKVWQRALVLKGWSYTAV